MAQNMNCHHWDFQPKLGYSLFSETAQAKKVRKQETVRLPLEKIVRKTARESPNNKVPVAFFFLS